MHLEAGSLTRDQLMDVIYWLVSDDTGVSSQTMAAIAIGAGDPRNFGAPYDADDFGRCYRLVKACPFIREHFGAIARVVPRFAPILAEWDELCALHERGDGVCERLARLLEPPGNAAEPREPARQDEQEP